MIPARSFLIATPCDDGHKLCYWDSLRTFERAYYTGAIPTEHRFDSMTPHGDSLISRARNNIAHHFITATDSDYLVQIDSDLDFRPEDIMRLADIAAANDFDMLAGLYAIKSDEMRWCINSLPGKTADAKTGLQEIAMAPGGCVIIHRRVFERMIAEAKAWPHWKVEYTEDASKRDGWNFYFDGVVLDLDAFPDKPRGRFLSEDWGFSYFARKLGFTIWCDTKSVFLHCGECFYPKQARRLAQSEVDSGAIKQEDGTTSPITPAEKV